MVNGQMYLYNTIMHFFIALGNPGKEYQFTRHNVGWMLVNYLRDSWGTSLFTVEKKLESEISKSSEVLLVKPQTFMNRSGDAVRKVLQWFEQNGDSSKEFSSVFIIHDDLDLEFGTFKIKFGSGPKVHNGVNSIRQILGTDQFWYVRIGVDSRNGDRRIPGQNYVLSNFTTEEQQVLRDVFSQIEKRLKELINI